MQNCVVVSFIAYRELSDCVSLLHFIETFTKNNCLEVVRKEQCSCIHRLSPNLRKIQCSIIIAFIISKLHKQLQMQLAISIFISFVVARTVYRLCIINITNNSCMIIKYYILEYFLHLKFTTGIVEFFSVLNAIIGKYLKDKYLFTLSNLIDYAPYNSSFLVFLDGHPLYLLDEPVRHDSHLHGLCYGHLYPHGVLHLYHHCGGHHDLHDDCHYFSYSYQG